MRKALMFLFVFLTAVTLFAQQNVSAPQKFALVIGNSNYTGISRLNNPVNDANDMEDALRALGFTVEKVLDGSLEQMETAVLNLKRSLGSSRNSYGFVFYAGHGVQSSGENYLIPVSADNIRSEAQLRDRAVSLQFVLDSLGEAGNELNMVVLDACRDNPFGWARSGSRGLNVVSRAPSGTIVMYAAGAGQTALDGTGRNGLFTSYLLTNLRDQNLSVFDVFDRTMANVIRNTSGRQHPELSLRASGSNLIFLGNRQLPAPTPAPNPNPAPHINMVRIEGGTYTIGSPSNEAGRRQDEIQRQVTVSSFYMSRYEVIQREYLEVMGTNPSSFTGDLNRPVEKVSWFDAIDYCNRLSRRDGLTPAYTISDSGNNRTVTWNRNANGYRLPTEAEWEYACRAGTATAYNTGINITARQANYNGNIPFSLLITSENRQQTMLAGTFAPNAWGLFDMHGNVWEWCWDWYGDYSTGAQYNPMGPASGIERVIRGGSWGNSAVQIRSARRDSYSPASPDYSIGFRVVRNAE